MARIENFEKQDLLKPLNAIEVMKFLGIMAMVTCHCFFFLHRFYPHIFQIPELSLYGRFFYFMGFGSMMLPAIAGIVFRDTLDKYFYLGKIRSFPMHKLIQSVLLLGFLDSLKTAITFSYSNAFKWDVLHFMGLCFFLLALFLQYFSVSRLILVILLALLLSIFDPQIYFHIFRSIFIFEYRPDYIITPVIYWSLAIVFAVFLIGVYLKFVINISRGHRLRRGVVGLAFALTSLYMWTQFCVLLQVHPYFLSIIWNLPLSIFIQMGQVGGHIWPLFPWFVLVALGFVLRHYRHKILSSSFMSWGLLLSCGGLFFYFIFFQLQVYQKLFSGFDFFGSSYFKPNTWLLAELCFALIFLYISCEKIFRRFKIFWSVVRDFSDGILFVYLFHFLLVFKLMPGAVKLWPSPALLWVYPFFIMFLTYCFLVGFLAISNKMIWFRLQKNKT